MLNYASRLALPTTLDETLPYSEYRVRDAVPEANAVRSLMLWLEQNPHSEAEAVYKSFISRDRQRFRGRITAKCVMQCKSASRNGKKARASLATTSTLVHLAIAVARSDMPSKHRELALLVILGNWINVVADDFDGLLLPRPAKADFNDRLDDEVKALFTGLCY